MTKFSHPIIYLAAAAAITICSLREASCGSSFQESVIVYGRSVEGRPLNAVVIGSGDNITLILGGIHGNELSSPGVVERLRGYLESHPALLAGNTVALVAHVNPDGDAAHTRANAHGVDLNRNFPTGWLPRRVGIALSPGRSPLSEPEGSALVKLVAQLKPSKVVSIHQPLDCLLPAGNGGEVLAKAMAAANGYKISESAGYPTPGSFGSYCCRSMNIAAVTLEMPRVDVDHAWAQNKDTLIAAIELQPAAIAKK
jgi:protein MpaA